MIERQTIQEFLEYLDDSGLPEDRKQFWIEKFSSGEFDEKDEKVFEEEMEEHVEDLEEDAGFLQFERDKLEEKRDEILASAGPDIATLVKEMPAALEKDFSDFKGAVADAEQSASKEIEDIRHSKESAEIDAIRKRLGKK